ncbi:HPP family protein [uncultured Sphingomonas sp.]|uniref:HPP family protein n=1 Tax=uncultured Sphingomonas sp. TaxID=158754 RepID=UPI0035CB3FD0
MTLGFLPILAGATLRDRLVACLGALVAISLTGLIAAKAVGAAAALLIVAPMGASAVLVFAVPASPLAQPWSVIGGNMISALVGVCVAQVVPIPALAAGVAVAGAILAMSLSRSLHPPGGATALMAVIGGPQIAALGFGFALVPVGVNAVILAAIGYLFHRLSGHSYPHVAAVPGAAVAVATAGSTMPHREDIDRALADLGETFDVSREDLDLLLQRAEFHAAERVRGRR